MNIKKLKKLAKSELNRADSGTDECKHYNNGFIDGINFTIEQLNLSNVKGNKNKNEMEAKNLRIGNYITLTKSFKEFCESRNVETSLLRVTKIGYQEVELNRLIDVNVSTIEAIPLTIEWVLKFNFKYNDFTTLYEFDDIQIDVSELETVIFYRGVEVVSTLKYVHELQNLFFTITGQELELKDKKK